MKPLHRRTQVARALLLVLLGLFLSALTPERTAVIQRQIEEEIKGFLKEQLASGEYFVYALVTDTAPAPDQTDASLPYVPLQVKRGILQDLLESNLPASQIASLKVEVTIGFDERIPADKRTVLDQVIRRRFGFDGEMRVLKVESLKLVSPRIADADRVDLERARSESERAKMDADRARLDNERAKMEAEQSRLKIETERLRMEIERKDLERAKLATTATVIATGTATASGSELTPPQPVQLSPSIAIFKDFQLTALGLVLGIVLVVAIIVGGSFFVRGMTPLSAALETVGSSIETAAKTAGGVGQTQIALNAEGGRQGAVGEDRAGGEAVPAAMQAVVGEVDQADREFLEMVQDKMEILAKERNFSFYRTFSDMLDSKQTLPLAASVLLALDPEVVRDLINHLSMEDITRVRAYMATEGALARAKRLKSQALGDFYGKIAMEEFLDSPLVKIKDLTWLTRMSTRQMAKFAASLAADERPVFLACLSPERAKRMIEVCESEIERSSLIEALSRMDQVTSDRILPVIGQISARFAGQTLVADRKQAVDSARYIAAIAADLPEAEQNRLFAALGQNDALTAGIREHYVPFAMIVTLPRELVVEIFTGRTDQQIAQMLFDAGDDLRRVVLAALPEIRAESVKDELKTLEDNRFYEKRNRKLSQRLQREVSVYLQKLYAEGLITFAGPGPAKTTPEGGAGGGGTDVDAA